MKSFNQFESTEEITHIKEQRLLAIQQQLDEIVGAGVKFLTGIGKIGAKGGKAGSKLPGKVPGAANQVPKQPGLLRSILTQLGIGAGFELGGAAINTAMQQGGFQGAVDPRALRNAYLKSQELKAMSYRQQDKDKKNSSGDKKPGRTGIAGLRDARST
jgi:hypothetical protein